MTVTWLELVTLPESFGPPPFRLRTWAFLYISNIVHKSFQSHSWIPKDKYKCPIDPIQRSNDKAIARLNKKFRFFPIAPYQSHIFPVPNQTLSSTPAKPELLAPIVMFHNELWLVILMSSGTPRLSSYVLQSIPFVFN